jgi:hypothetical protein
METPKLVGKIGGKKAIKGATREEVTGEKRK